MGDERHKRPPPADDEEDVTDAFRQEARVALDINEQFNRLRKLRRGDPGYKISNQAELADALGTSNRMVSKILGAVKDTTKLKLVSRSVFVGRIRTLLELAPITKISVRVSRSAVLQFIADLPDEQFKVFEDEYKRRSRNGR